MATQWNIGACSWSLQVKSILELEELLKKVGLEWTQIALGDPNHASWEEDDATFVARVDGEIAGFGAVGWLDNAEADGARRVPPGWFLTGLVVAPAWRRRGIGAALTAHRLDWVRGRAEVVYYFANARNGATIDLHRRLGFEEVTREFAIPGVAFDGGVGVLYWAQLRGAEASGTAGP